MSAGRTEPALDRAIGTGRARIAALPRTIAVPALSAEATAVITIVLGAFLLRLFWVSFTGWHPIPDDDSYRYDFAARALAEGRGYIHLNGEPTAFWPPGYSLLLAAVYTVFGESVLAAQLLNVVLSTATVALVYLIGRLTMGRQAAFVGASIVAAFPSLIFFTGVTLSETAFTFFALLAIALVLLEARNPQRRDLRLLLGAGLAFGFASLIRGQALLLPIVLIPFWLRAGTDRSRIADKLVAIALGIGLIVAPWTIRNTIQLDKPVLISTNAGVDLWIGHHPSARGNFGSTGGDALVFRHAELDPVARELRANSEGFREALTFALTHPAQELALPFEKLFWLYANDEEGLKWNEGHGGQPFLSAAARGGLLFISDAYYFAVFVFLVLGARLWFSHRDPGKLLLCSLVGYWTLVHLVFFGDPRFHAPIMPVVALLAAPALVALWAGRPARVRQALEPAR